MYSNVKIKGNSFKDSAENLSAAKKPNFIFRWLSSKLKSVSAYEQNLDLIKEPSAIRRNYNIDQPERAIRFTVYTANGGRVIETYRYDPKKDNTQSGLYIITNDQEFGKELDKIISMEYLKSI